MNNLFISVYQKYTDLDSFILVMSIKNEIMFIKMSIKFYYFTY
jgi:hypothetical protein